MPPSDQEVELRKLLEENIALARDTNRILREMRRNAWIGLIAKAVLWLFLLGVPIFFLSSYLGPLMAAFGGTGNPAEAGTPGLFGLPNQDQVDQLLKEYQELQQGS